MGKIIFVAGVPRSGTTLVQNILDCHPEIYGGAEFDRIPNIIDLRRKLLASIKNERIDVYLNKNDVNKIIAELIIKLLMPVALKNKCSFVSEKTPWNILAFPDLVELLPDAKFFHVLRHPHAVIYSMQKVAERARTKKLRSPDFTKDIALGCYYYESVLKIIYQIEKSSPSKVLTIKLEDILLQPKIQVEKMCSYLGIKFNKDMLKPGDQKHPGEKNMIKNEIWYSKESFQRNISIQDNDTWITTMNGAVIAFLNYVFLNNRLIENYNYSFSFKGISRFDRIRGYYLYKKYLKRFDFSVLPSRVLG